MAGLSGLRGTNHEKERYLLSLQKYIGLELLACYCHCFFKILALSLLLASVILYDKLTMHCEARVAEGLYYGIALCCAIVLVFILN